MANTDLIDSLITTYRTLNLAIRPMPRERAAQLKANGTSLLEIVRKMRDHELATSLQLKAMATGDTHVPGTAEEVPLVESVDQDNVHVLLSEFGTAREAILAQVRQMPEEQWDAERRGPKGPTTIQAFIANLVEHDRQMMQQIEPMIAARAM